MICSCVFTIAILLNYLTAKSVLTNDPVNRIWNWNIQDIGVSPDSIFSTKKKEKKNLDKIAQILFFMDISRIYNAIKKKILSEVCRAMSLRHTSRFGDYISGFPFSKVVGGWRSSMAKILVVIQRLFTVSTASRVVCGLAWEAATATRAAAAQSLIETGSFFFHHVE